MSSSGIANNIVSLRFCMQVAAFFFNNAVFPVIEVGASYRLHVGQLNDKIHAEIGVEFK